MNIEYSINLDYSTKAEQQLYKDAQHLGEVTMCSRVYTVNNIRDEEVDGDSYKVLELISKKVLKEPVLTDAERDTVEFLESAIGAIKRRKILASAAVFVQRDETVICRYDSQSRPVTLAGGLLQVQNEVVQNADTQEAEFLGDEDEGDDDV